MIFVGQAGEKAIADAVAGVVRGFVQNVAMPKNDIARFGGHFNGLKSCDHGEIFGMGLKTAVEVIGVFAEKFPRCEVAARPKDRAAAARFHVVNIRRQAEEKWHRSPFAEITVDVPSSGQAPLALRFGQEQAQVAIFAAEVPAAELIDNGFDFGLVDELRFRWRKAKAPENGDVCAVLWAREP